MFVRFLPLLALACCAATPAPVENEARSPAATSEWAASCTDWDEWDKPGPPFRISGNAYYVGTCGISAILITGEEGHILIDSGTEAGADIVAANIAKLGFAPTDVMVLLMSHEHFDHVGGMARLQELTGAQLVVTPLAAPAMSSGQMSADDPQYGIHGAFPAVRVDDVLDAEMTVWHGDLAIKAIPTPGHTPGATSWQWESCDETGQCRTIVYADSLSPVSRDEYRFSDHPDYLAAYRDSITRLAALDCDILLTPHPSASKMRDRAMTGSFEGGMSCAQYAETLTARLDKRLAEEAGH